MIEPGHADHPNAPRGTFDFTVYSPSGLRVDFTVELGNARVKLRREGNEGFWWWDTLNVPCIKGFGK